MENRKDVNSDIASGKKIDKGLLLKLIDEGKVVRIAVDEDGGFIPKQMTDGAGGYDLASKTYAVINPGRQSIPLGFKMQFGYGMVSIITGRSGHELFGFEAYEFTRDENGNIIIDDQPKRIDADVLLGVIDSDYRKNPGVIIKSNHDRPVIIKPGARIAQMLFVPVIHPTLYVDSEVDPSERDGFNSTGTN